MHSIKIYRRHTVRDRIFSRDGERKLGESIGFLKKGQSLDDLDAFVGAGSRYALIGIPEFVGPMANHGRCCTDNAWSVFLRSFLNIQSNRFLTGESILCLGHLDAVDILREAERLDPQGPGFLESLRQLVNRLDDRVSPVIETVVKAGLKPVVIGGGHNNAYPLLKGAALGKGTHGGVDCLNVDPHADLRKQEGRHSGNSFSYALEEELLHRYFVLGLHEAYNPQDVLARFADPEQMAYAAFEPGCDIAPSLEKTIGFFRDFERPLGLEVDMDSIAGMPSSAATPTGFTLDQVRRIVREAAAALNTVYFHLSEAAPRPGNPDELMVGKALAILVYDYIRADSLSGSSTG